VNDVPSGEAPPWLDPDEPLEPDESARQIAALRKRLSGGSRCVLDLGSGSGRTLVPLVSDGHRMVGVDQDAAALERCRRRVASVHGQATLKCGNMLCMSDPIWSDPEGGIGALGPYDLVCCLGNTFMMVTDPAEAIKLIRAIAQVLAPGGGVVIDDFPGALRSELTEGNWLEGISDEGDLQMVWARGDALFALRQGKDVRPDDWTIHADEPRYRLWDYGALDLLAAHGGLVPLPRDAGDDSMLIEWQRGPT